MDGEALSFTGIKNHHSIATIVLEEAAPSLFYVTVEPHKLKFGSPIDFPEISCKVPVVLSVQCLEEVFDVWLWFFLGDKDHTKGVFGVETDILAALVVELRD